MNEFAAADEADRVHLSSIGRPTTHIRPEMRNRAADFSASLIPLSAIEPVLTSSYLIKGWLDQGAASVVYGESNVGKTFFALDLAMHVAADRAWNGHKVDRGDGSVVYVASEGGFGIKNRLAAMRMERPDLVEAVEAEGSFHLLATVLDLCGPGDAEALIKAVRGLDRQPILIVIDTLARSMGEGDESSAQDMNRLIKNVDQLRRETGAHVVLVHHSGKDATRGARGSSSLRGAIDTEIHLTRTGMIINAETKKQRDMIGGKEVAFSLTNVHLGYDQDGDEVTSCVVEATEPVKAAAPKLTGRPEIAMQALGDALAEDGEVKSGEIYPARARCVAVSVWREWCYRHGLADGETDGARRKAFYDAKKKLHERGFIKIIDDYVWRSDG